MKKTTLRRLGAGVTACLLMGGFEPEKVKDGVTGLHFRAGSAESLVDRLVEVLRNPGLWDRLQGRIKRPLSAREAAMQHRALYREILERRNGAKPARDRSASTSAAAAAVAAE